MVKLIWSAAAALSLSAGVVSAAEIGPAAALDTYCEPLMGSGPAAPLEAKARAAGFTDTVVMGQPMLKQGELLMRLSDTPRVCFLQAPKALTFAQGVAIVDAWAARHPGAILAPTTVGPDGRPVKAWTSPTRRVSAIVTQQPDGAGGQVVNLLLMPLPAGIAPKQ